MQTQLFERRPGDDYCKAMPAPEDFVFKLTNSTSTVTSNKPVGCLWTSTYTGEQTGSAWIQWCLAGLYGTDGHRNPFDCYLLSPSKWANILTIVSHDDLLAVWKRYPLSEQPYKALNFEAIAQSYDAITLTDKGILECREVGRNPQLWHWHTECTVWFRQLWTVEHIGLKTFGLPG